MRESASLAMTLSNVWRAGPAPIILCRELNRELCRNPRGQIDKVHDKARDEGNRSGIRHLASSFALRAMEDRSGIRYLVSGTRHLASTSSIIDPFHKPLFLPMVPINSIQTSSCKLYVPFFP